MLSRQCHQHAPRWLLLSDIHFRPRDLDRTRRTADWIVSLARQTPGISRAVVCGDVLTSRTMQPTAVLSAAYRFLSDLSQSVPHMNVILGNHDLAYRRDYSTTALEGIKMAQLRPFMSLHDEVGKYEWDGRRVLVLPFREDQTELTDAVSRLDPDEAAQTVAFAHLALNRAVTQRHIIRDDGVDLGFPVRYKGLIGPNYFSALSRTFTGHFHSHQTILQSGQHAPPASCGDNLKGSVTYIGAPLHLTWADLHDDNRGVILFNPATLEHELIINPHAVGYMTIQGSDVLSDNFDASKLQDKHVMMLGQLTPFQYWTAREKLLAFGVLSVREQRPTATLRNEPNPVAYHSLGSSVPASDRGVALESSESSDLPAEPSQSTGDGAEALPEPEDLQSVKIDPVDHVRDYVQSLVSESMDKEKTIQLGQRLILASDSTASLGDNAGYKVLLDSTYSIATQGDFGVPTKPVFVAKPRSITIANFLGVQEECTIDFEKDLGRGLTFVIGSNGSGKSTLIEAIVWCQFGRCIRKGLTVGDVVNDITDKDCMVSLSFSNGYTITRYRKHTTYSNRVIVSLHGVEQPQFEHGDVRSAKTALDELLGVDYEEFIKTVVLGHESAASFLSSTPAQRHDLIETTLGLSRLDTSAELSRRMVREIDTDSTALRNMRNTVEQTMSHIEGRIDQKKSMVQQLHMEAEEARREINESREGNDDSHSHQSHDAFEEELKKLSERLEALKSQVTESRQAVDQAQSVVKESEILDDIAAKNSMLDQRVHTTQSQIQALKDIIPRLESSQPHPVMMEHVQTLRNLAQAISQIHPQVLNATGYLSPDTPVNKVALSFIRICLKSLEQLSNHLNHLIDQFTPLVSEQQLESADAADNAVEETRKKLSEAESSLVRLAKERVEVHTRVALDRGLDEDYVRSLSNRPLKINLMDARRQASFSLNHLSELMREQGALHDLLAKHQRDSAKMSETARSLAPLLEKLARKEQEITTYQKLIEEEALLLDEQRASHAAITSEIESLMNTRQLFAFWEESLSRRRTKSTGSTFRGYVLDKGLQELNILASKILLILYENTHHARELTKGMLRTMIAADPDPFQDSGNPQATALLDQSLGVTKAMSYAKRSGGERKRIDLAVFFALVQILQARSPHRARYILVDEAFDNLDVPGQAAVVRWCSQLMAWTDFQLVITHSEYLANSARNASNDEDGADIESHFSVLSARMTKEGTKFSNTTA